MNQREPRLHDDGYLRWLRKRPCCVCGRPGPSDAAHIRFSSERHNKRETGLAEKPHDRFAVPLCRVCHISQHSCNEREWWRERRIAPLAVAEILYSEYGGNGGRPKPKRTTIRPRLPKEERQRIPSRPFLTKGKRKMAGRAKPR